MKTIKIKILTNQYEIELEDEFFEYIKGEVDKLNSSQTQIKDLLDLMLRCKYENFKIKQNLVNLSDKLNL